jgi:Cu-Zn family superoxide dismutase
MHRSIQRITRSVMMSLAAALLATAAEAATGTATIHGTSDDSPISGIATFTDTDRGLEVSIRIASAPPGQHGIHIHQFGACDSGGNAAGSHYNPDGVKHGYLLSDGLGGAHAGDLGNIEIGPDGSGHLDLIILGLTVTGGKYSVAGRSVILHAQQDDFGQPTGNAGGRIGCGVIVITGE